jgi:hypothetical protein
MTTNTSGLVGDKLTAEELSAIKSFAEMLSKVKTIADVKDLAAKLSHLVEKGDADRTGDDERPAAQSGRYVLGMPCADAPGPLSWPMPKVVKRIIDAVGFETASQPGYIERLVVLKAKGEPLPLPYDPWDSTKAERLVWHQRADGTLEMPALWDGDK